MGNWGLGGWGFGGCGGRDRRCLCGHGFGDFCRRGVFGGGYGFFGRRSRSWSRDFSLWVRADFSSLYRGSVFGSGLGCRFSRRHVLRRSFSDRLGGCVRFCRRSLFGCRFSLRRYCGFSRRYRLGRWFRDRFGCCGFLCRRRHFGGRNGFRWRIRLSRRRIRICFHRRGSLLLSPLGRGGRRPGWVLSRRLSYRFQWRSHRLVGGLFGCLFSVRVRYWRLSRRRPTPPLRGTPFDWAQDRPPRRG